jgi:hypothetical protein
MTMHEVGDLASRISDDSAVADSSVEATGAEAEGFDWLIVEWRSDARALSELMEKLGR